jgi:hypothetical protein
MLEADLQAIGRDRTLSHAAWYERQQLWRFLCAAAGTELLQYPIAIDHTSNSRPDFLLRDRTREIGVEASRLTTEAYERLELTRARGQTAPCITISSALATTARLRNDELIQVSAPGGQGWRRAVDDEEFYVQQAVRVIRRKTVIRRAEGYHDHGHNWLILWDKLSLNDRDFMSRPRLLQSRLTPYWTETDRFDTIIIESDDFRRFAISTPGELR